MEDRSRILEDRVEHLTRELADVINDAAVPGRPAIRGELRDFAISVLQDSVAPVDIQEPVETSTTDGPLNPLGFGIPLFFAGGILFFLFPPVGLLLLVAAVAMILWGLATSMLSRRRR